MEKTILEEMDEILTLIRLGQPLELRHSLASANIIESMNAVIRQVCRNVKWWHDAKMALRWTASGMHEAAKGFPRLKAALLKHRDPCSAGIDRTTEVT